MITHLPRKVQTVAPAQDPGSPALSLAGECPYCRRLLILKQTRDGARFYVACTLRRCDFTSAYYDPVPQQLSDRVARLTAELALCRMQDKAVQP